MKDKQLQIIKEFPGKARFVHYFVYSCSGINGVVKGPEPRVAQYLRETFHKEYGPAIVMQSRLMKRHEEFRQDPNISFESNLARIQEISRLRDYKYPTITGIYVLGMTDETRKNCIQISINKISIRKKVFRWEIFVKDIRLASDSQVVYHTTVRNMPQCWFKDFTIFIEGANLQYLQNGKDKIFKQMEQELKALRSTVKSQAKNNVLHPVKSNSTKELNSEVDSFHGIEL